MTHIAPAAIIHLWLRRSRRAMLLLTFLTLLTCNAVAQQEQTRSATDGSTPLALQQGQPAGSFALSGFENVNPYNGNLNFHLPLLGIGGRGSAQMTMMLSIDSKGWQIKHHDVFIPDPDCGAEAGQKCVDSGSYYTTNIPEPNRWSPSAGYGAGLLYGRSAGTGQNICTRQGSMSYSLSLTRLFFVTPDGTEYELRDQLYAGQPKPVTGGICNGGRVAVSRGKIFISADGNAATFVSDQPINDKAYAGPSGTERIYPSGSLMLKDGSRYRIDEGKVTWVHDRNGNMLSFTYATNYMEITDSLNRQVIIEQNVNDVWPYGQCDRITYKGFGGATRAIRVSSTNLSNVLRPGFTVKTYKQLFPELSGSPNSPWNPTRVSAVWLPDGRSYKLYYNSYGELARVELPTEGAIEYDYTPGSGCIDETGSNCTDDSAERPEIYRRVTTRRLYQHGGTLEQRLTFSDPNVVCPLYPCDSDTIVTVDHFNAAGGRLLRERHYYYGNPVESLWQSGVSYPSWKNGREYKSETIDSNGSTILRRVENTWAQRTPLPTWYASAGDDAPPHDVRLAQALTTLLDTGTNPATGTTNPGKASKQNFTYDQYNNRTDVYEYDYGADVAGPFRRRTHTDYLTTNPVGGDNYDSLSPSVTNSYAATAAPSESPCESPCAEGDDQGSSSYTTETGVDSAIHIRNLPTRQWVSSDAGGNQKQSITTYEYDNYMADAKHAALLARSGISGLDSSFTTAKKARGNVTAVTRRLISGNKDITTYQQYDVAGSVVKAIGANGNATTFDLTDRFGTPIGPPAGTGNVNSFTLKGDAAQADSSPVELTETASQSYAFVTKVTMPAVAGVAQVNNIEFDYYTGKTVNFQEANGTVYSAFYEDPLDRPTRVISDYQDAALRMQTKFIYDNENRTTTIANDRCDYGDELLKKLIIHDGLGRMIETRSYEDANNYIAVLQAYDGMGRISSKSNPYRPNSGETAVFTTTTYDEFGRPTVVTSPKPENAKFNTAYEGNVVTVRDQAGKDRQSTTDALGRLVEVIEDPGTGGLNYQTTYEYDVLDNLTKVVQGGAQKQTRTFTYDSLKRMTQSVNPESGTIKYEYDDGGNLTKKIDPRKLSPASSLNVETTLAYDALNRVVSKTYNDGTPNILYKYDAQALPAGAPGATVINRGASLGRLIAVTYGGTAAGNYYGYDGLGQVARKVQQTDGVNYLVDATYNRAGAAVTETYPAAPRAARRMVTHTFDEAGRLASISTAGAGVSDIRYASHGALASESYGTLLHQISYNNRMQPTAIKLGTVADPTLKLNLSYGYGTTNNNGNTLSANITLDGQTWQQIFTYDSLNRLDVAKETIITSALTDAKVSTSVTDTRMTGPETEGKATAPASEGEGADAGAPAEWTQNFDYDQFGNRCLRSATAPGTPCALEVNPLNNRLSGRSYDLAGNQLFETPEVMFTYDAENRLKTVQGVPGYVYDGEGQRVRKLIGENLRMVYGIGGELLAEFDGASGALKKEYIYGADGLAATIEPGVGTRYITADKLGSPRIITGNNGAVLSRHDYQPFGEELTAGFGARTAAQGYDAGDGLRQKFTGKERDYETGLDYFIARYYASTNGRFTSPDPLMASGRPANPQTWNRYAYVLNNPLRMIDPTGMVDTPAENDPSPQQEPRPAPTPPAPMDIRPPESESPPPTPDSSESWGPQPVPQPGPEPLQKAEDPFVTYQADVLYPCMKRVFIEENNKILPDVTEKVQDAGIKAIPALATAVTASTKISQAIAVGSAVGAGLIYNREVGKLEARRDQAVDRRWSTDCGLVPAAVRAFTSIVGPRATILLISPQVVRDANKK